MPLNPDKKFQPGGAVNPSDLIQDTIIQGSLIQACADLKVAAGNLDRLEMYTRGEKAHNQIETIYNQVQEARTVLSEILADHLIDQRNRVSL